MIVLILFILISMLISMVLGLIFGMIITYIVDRERYRGKTVKFLMDKTPSLFVVPVVGLLLSIGTLLVFLLAFIVYHFLKWTKLNLVLKIIGEYIDKMLNTKINI